ncbi:NACHT nucleoside triphosphatase [Macrophomina phaseolina MS6]|uniref:NACHT nucleoside triphosphatase n=1 Tax=Macrophomina phaseolina (strain MS6) TaxID=1126212 RepID=K2RHJ9_MACPH|nr:NACHT nucleoside triphosphatase [Macrophomina phaseolina MS6]
MGSNAAQLLKELEEIDEEATQESVFLRGVAYLRSIQVPLERFKLALDLASPLTSLDPTATTVFGVVRSVTAIAISFATADLEFAKQIGDMLEQISYIDDCDTLGQRANKADIHKALVSVYQKILEFYLVAHEILTRRGRKLIMKMILETDRLPNIVQDFLRHADTLRKLIEKATFEIVEDIKTMLYDHEIARWLDSGKLNLQSRYHARLQDLRTDEACEILLTHSNFVDWYRASNSEWLVILGPMGCGKTVATAFLVDELSRRNEHHLPRPKVCYYYCRDDETGQAVHIFSTLVLALLEQLSGLKKTFYEWYKENQASGIPVPATSTKKLGEFLEMVLETLDRPLFIVVDGLDECDRGSRNDLLKLLRTLSQKTPRLKILLSSRPEEEILEQLDEAIKIDMCSDVHRDAVIVRHTVERQLSHLPEDVRALIIESLSRLAQGSAIWVKMVVELIEVRKIRALGPMRTFLDHMPLPGQLSKLYVTLLSRSSSNDPENEQLATLALKILAVACRPLSIQELAWAVALAAVQHEVTTVAALAQLVDSQRVMSLIHPFITRIDFTDGRKRQVQLVHQSVREFIVWEWPRLQGSATLAEHDQALSRNHTESLDAFILNICIDYLLLEEIGGSDLFSEEQVAIDELPQEFDLFNETESFEYDPHCSWEAWEKQMIRYDPTERGFGEFFVYASSHWLKHFGVIETGPLPSLAKIESLCHAGSTRLKNWTSQNCRPDCTIKARFEFDSRLYDPLSITSLYGSDPFLRLILRDSNFDRDKYLRLPAICAAEQIFQWGNLSRLRVLFLEGKLSHELRNLDFFRLVIRRWVDFGARHDDWEVVFELVDYILDTLVEEKWGNELLCIAARAGCMPMIHRLLYRARHKPELKTELLRGFQSIGQAVLGNHTGVVEYLLREEGFEKHLQYLNSRGENLLHMASGACDPAMFRLLVPNLQMSMNQTDSQGDTALLRVIKSPSDSWHRYESARVLLSYVDFSGNSNIGDRQQDPLQVAVQLGDVEMCRLLICEGKMNPLSVLIRRHDGQLAIKNKPWTNEEAILQLLRKHSTIALTA